MNFAIANSDALNTLGVPGLVFVILVLAGVVIFLYKGRDAVQTKFDNAMQQRVTDAKETRDKITQVQDKQVIMLENIYDLLRNPRGK